ncbi:DUF2235 domain-containing protein [Thioclava sp. A2]|uniref:DUF2235 domain-containing protein n=1 Tax=Thioclava sp. FCG-A2 TaxID=3080562 RepID=UPI0029556903|nr:DUF2235 domain-containing protein [Thioclava sp. A2]MDV7271532.1 DUF2235 domain-containing protein [Thioclava sp. A2]
MRGLIERFMLALRRLPGWSPMPGPSPRKGREPVDHVILLDGTLGSLKPEKITSIGILYHFLRRAAPRLSLYYGKGLQWREWRDLSEVWLGWGVDRQIERAYGWLASRYRPGDRIYLIGYSRGAFAARSLAGMIGQIGLLRSEEAIERHVIAAWRLYEGQGTDDTVAEFRAALCHPETPIELVGVFDTVMGLGIQLPVLWMLSEPKYRFHNHHLGPHVRFGAQALALDETRSIFEPLIWDSDETGADRIEQKWFRGSHADIGGQLGEAEEARALANIPLVWMIGRMQRAGIPLPDGWAERFETDVSAPSVGTWHGVGRLFWLRAPRVAGRDPSESLHPSALQRSGKPKANLRPHLKAAFMQVSGSVRRPHDKAGGGSGGVKAAILDAANLAARDTG